MTDPSSSTDQHGPSITLATFQAENFNVSNLVQSLMEEDVRKAKQEGGGASMWSCAVRVRGHVPLSDERPS